MNQGKKGGEPQIMSGRPTPYFFLFEMVGLFPLLFKANKPYSFSFLWPYRKFVSLSLDDDALPDDRAGQQEEEDNTSILGEGG